MYFILIGSNFSKVRLWISSFELVTPERFPFVSSSKVKRQSVSCKAHFTASVCNFAACSLILRSVHQLEYCPIYKYRVIGSCFIVRGPNLLITHLSSLEHFTSNIIHIILVKLVGKCNVPTEHWIHIMPLFLQLNDSTFNSYMCTVSYLYLVQ